MSEVENECKETEILGGYWPLAVGVYTEIGVVLLIQWIIISEDSFRTQDRTPKAKSQLIHFVLSANSKTQHLLKTGSSSTNQ